MGYSEKLCPKTLMPGRDKIIPQEKISVPGGKPYEVNSTPEAINYEIS
jgi:hypothetical protein